MKAEALLSRLEKVKASQGGWVACCPAHHDKSPSLSVRELDDGRVLVHCFAGCSVEEIVSAVGMDMGALFPDDQPKDHRVKPLRRPFPAADVLESLRSESLFVAVCAGNMANGVALSIEDKNRLFVSAERIQEGARLANG